MILIIGTKRYSSWSLRPWLAARVAGQAFDEVQITLRQPDTKAHILAHSPSGKVPCLKDGDVVIWDSLAICEYLAERHPHLWPADGAARAVARSVSAEMHSGFVTLRTQCPMDMAQDHPMPDITPELAADITRIHTLWADCRTRFGAGGPFLFGAFSVADAMFAPVVSRFSTYGITGDAVVTAYMAAMWSLPAMTQWKEQAAGQ